MKDRDTKQKEEIDELKEEMSILKKFEEEFEQEIYEKKKFAEEISEMTDDPKVYDLLNEKMSLVRKMERESESVLSEAYEELNRKIQTQEERIRCEEEDNESDKNQYI